MNDSHFLSLAESSLQALQEEIETTFQSCFEVEYQEGVLEITLEDEREYIINRHLPQHQIWLSSPVSGAYYFNYDEAKRAWVDAKGGKIHLRSFLIEELKNVAVQTFLPSSLS